EGEVDSERRRNDRAADDRDERDAATTPRARPEAWTARRAEAGRGRGPGDGRTRRRPGRRAPTGTTATERSARVRRHRPQGAADHARRSSGGRPTAPRLSHGPRGPAGPPRFPAPPTA